MRMPLTNPVMTIEEGVRAAGVGRFQHRLFALFSLVWLAAAMQVLSIGFTAPSIGATFGVPVATALRTGTTFFTGMLIGALLFGRLADRFGRRPVLTTAILLDAASAAASAHAPDLQWLLLLRFAAGLGVGGTLPVAYTMMAEFLPPDRRGRWLVLMESFWAVGTILLAVLALAALSRGNDAWRLIFLASGAPAWVGVILPFLTTESPLFLNKAGRAEQARRALWKVAATNRVSAPLIAALKPQRVERTSALALFAIDSRRRSLCLLVAWTLMALSYYGVLVHLPVKLAGQGFDFMRGHVFLIVLAIAQLPGFVVSAYGVQHWGRKRTLIAFLLLSAAGCLLYSLGNFAAVVVGSTLLMNFALQGAWGALYALTPEVFPTHLRASGMGATGAAARFGGLFAPAVLAPVMATHFTLSLVFLTALLMIAALAIALVDVESRDHAFD